MDPKFLTLAQVQAIQHDQMIRYGGSFGIRDLSLLESAVETPKATFGGQFLHEDLYSMAAA
jgi:death on curing protein